MPKLPALQSLRAIAASLVVLNHSLGVAAGHGLAQHPYSDLGNFLGAQGVAIFFLISGFIMTYTADSPDDSVPPSARALHFATRRIARVVPLYWFFTLLVAGIASLIGFSKALDTTPLNLLKSLFFIPYRNSLSVMLPVLPLGWTLNYEMFFYTLFAAFLLLPHRYRILGLFGTLAAMVLAGSFFYPVLSGNLPRSIGEFLTHPIILLFGFGALLGSLRLRYPEFTLRIPGILLAVPLLALNCFFAHVANETPMRLQWYALFWIVDLGLLTLCVFGRPLPLPWLETLGDASYSLYLVHILPLFVSFLVWKQLHFAIPLAFIVASLALCFVTAHTVYRWLERPFTRAALRLIAGPLKPVVRAEPALEPLVTPALQEV